MESTRSRSRSPDEDSRHHHPKPEYKSNEEESKNDSSTTSNMPVLSATATPEDEEKPTYNIWAGDLDPAVTEHDLMGAFEMCGNIHSASIVRDRVNGTSRGYGFVNFTTPESRKMALEKYGDSVTLYGRKVKIVMSDSKNSIYIGALPKDTREEDLRAKVQEWAGPFEHLYFKPQTGYAFVEYINHMKAEKAYQLMKNQTFMGVAIKVQPAQSREKKAKFQQQQQHQANIPQSTTLFFKNIHESIDSDKLKDYVSRFGDVTKATVINNPQTGKSKGFGFVEFSSLKDSLHAQKALDGIMWNAQRLSVEFSVKDRDRRGGAAGPSGGRGLPPHLHPAGYGYDMPRMHDPRDLRFASAYDRGYPSVYSDRDPRDSRDRDRDRTSSRRTRDPLYDATPYYVDPRIAAAYGAYPDPYAEYGYADSYADYPRTAAVSARDYDRDRVRYPDERLDERVSSRTLRERSDRDRTPAASTTTTSDRDRDRIRDRDRYTTPTVPAVAADHLAMMDRYGAYALLEQQYRGTGAAPRAGAGAAGAAGTDRDADYLRSQSRGYRY